MNNRFVRTVACALAVAATPAVAWAAPEVRQPCPAEPTDMPIEYGDLVSCEISPVGDLDVFRFEGQAGERVVVGGSWLAGGGTPCVELRGPAPGDPVVAPWACANYPRLDAVLPASGLFTIRVTEYANDQIVSYGLTLERVTPASPTARDVCRNCTATDQIDPVGDLDLFSFAGRAGDDVIIQATRQAGGTPCLQQYGPTGAPVGSARCADIARQDLRLEQDGLYTILVSEYALDHTLDYTLYFECIGVCPAPPGTSDLGLTLSDSPDPVIGSTPLTYTLAVSNTGPDVAQSLSVSHSLSAGVAFDSATGSGWTCGHSSGTVTCTRPFLAVGAAPNITVQVTPGPAATVLSSSATVSATQTDPDTANNSDTETTTVVAAPPTKNLLYLKVGAPATWTTSGAAGSQAREILQWQSAGYTVTTRDLLTSPITASLLAGYEVLRLNGAWHLGWAPTPEEGLALESWVRAGGRLLAECPVRTCLPPVVPFGVSTIDGANGGPSGLEMTYHGSPWILGPVSGPVAPVPSLAASSMDRPVLTPGHTLTIDVAVDGNPAVVHGQFGGGRVVIVFLEFWSHDAPYPGHAYNATIYQASNLDFLSNCIQYLGGALPPPTDFFTVTPCRVFDTRQASGPTAGAPLTCGTARTFTIVGGTCGVPASAQAVSVNLTATASTAQGNLRLFPAGAPAPLVSTLNYTAGLTRANNAVAALGTSGQISVLCSPSGTTHVLLDVNGYFE